MSSLNSLLYNLCYLAILKSRFTLYGNARREKTLAEREVGLAIILGIFNTVNESDHETK